ncbi:two-component regulator propeller domain-containing protein [Chryseolinea sp. T2]|uniref:sensor histidine kinase n=1 Tax=Chryseolinea sp. T2 TaxID=3129255 RepID=UPI003077DBD4
MCRSRAHRQLPHLPVCAIIILLVFTGGRTCAQTSAQHPIEVSYLSVPDGLSSAIVHSVFQDSYGFLWFCTNNGLQKYDGYGFQTYKRILNEPTSIASNVAWHVSEDKDNNLWVSNGAGVSVLDRRTGLFKNYEFSPRFNLTAGIDELVFKTLRDSQGRLWAGTRDIELAQFDPAADDWKPAFYDVPQLDPRAPHSGTTLAIAEDSKGGIWSSSSAFGLMHMPAGAKGFKQVVLNESPAPAAFNIEKNYITALYIDEHDIVWIASRNGVYKYFPEAGELKTIKIYTESMADNNNHFNDIVRDPSGNVWVMNNWRGMLKFPAGSDAYEEIAIAGRTRVPGRAWNITMTSLTVDKSGIFWFGSLENGAIKYDPVNKPFSVFVHEETNPSSITGNSIFGAAASTVKPGVIYVGIRGIGLNVYDPSRAAFQKVPIKFVNDRFGGSARGLTEARDGSVWVGSFGDGLIKLDKDYHEVARYGYDAKSETSISGNVIRVIREGKDKQLWVGTNSGLCVLDPATGNFQRIVARDAKHYPLSLLTSLDNLMSGDGLIGKIDKAQNIEDKTLKVEIQDSGTYVLVVTGEADYVSPADFGWIENLKNDTIWSFPEFESTHHAGGGIKNRVVVAPVKLEAGSYLLRYKTDDSHAYGNWNEQAPDQISLYGIALLKIGDESILTEIDKSQASITNEMLIAGSNIQDVEITDKYVWVSAIGSGVSRIDQVARTVETFTYKPDDVNSLISNQVNDILSDKRGNIWLASVNGLSKFDGQTRKFINYGEHDGLPTNIVTSILEGDNDELWIATENGISQMVPNEKLGKVTFINYNSTDGLGGDLFTTLTGAKSSDGRFYFGGEHGLTTFTSIAANKTPPIVVFSNLLVSNKSVLAPDDEVQLTGGLENAKSIEVPYNKDNLSFEFAALHFANPKKNQYAHMLKGYDKDWVYDNRNFASYTNLDPGEYDFMVRASNAYGIWNEEGKSIHITIHPPWWQTWWAYVSYCLAFIGVVYAGDKGIRSSIKARERERSRQKELKQAREIEKAYTHLKETQAQLVQSEKMASLGALTAGIAHEIQNPLNFVNNFAEINRELLEEMNEEIASGNLDHVKELAQNIADNESKISYHGRRADAIVKGMLQHSRTSSGTKEPTDINAIADEYLRLAYHGLRAKDKSFNASMKTEFDPAVGKINVVSQDLGRVILNLITNAFYVVAEKRSELNGRLVNGVKYEPTVTVSTHKVSDNVEIRVNDNGTGIPQSVLDKIFQPFFTTKPSGKGTGLGLSMSYEIVTKGHGGELKVETKVGQGTTFIIVLPNAIINENTRG